MSDEQFTLHSSTPIDQQLSFAATVVYVDNFTTLWIYIPSAGRYAPPLRPGVGFALTRTVRAQARFQAPPGQTNGALSPGQAAILTFTNTP